MPHSRILIEARGLSKSYKDRVAVDGVGFCLHTSEIVGLLGANGAGKSTTMRMLSGTLQPDSGTAEIAGKDIIQNRRSAQSAIGYLPEAASGFAALTVREVLTFFAEARLASRSAAWASVEAALGRLDLIEAADRTLSELSKGWRQRVWLAQALLHDPPVLILDEPTDGLDPGQKVELRKHLRELAEGRVILMSTHILEEAEQLCDRLLIMSAGRLVADGPVSDFADGSGRIASSVLTWMAPTTPAAGAHA